jgi:uncharacterized protein
LHHFFYSPKLKIGDQYIIQFRGLKEGVHGFEFSIGKPFFESFEQLEIPDGNVEVGVELTKKNAFLELDLELTGDVQVQCDRCLGYFSLPVSYNAHLVVRFSETEQDPDDEIIFLHPEDHQLDLKQYLYEFISVSIPIRKVHPDLDNGEPGCDREMLKILQEHLIKE